MSALQALHFLVSVPLLKIHIHVHNIWPIPSRQSQYRMFLDSCLTIANLGHSFIQLWPCSPRGHIPFRSCRILFLAILFPKLLSLALHQASYMGIRPLVCPIRYLWLLSVPSSRGRQCFRMPCLFYARKAGLSDVSDLTSIVTTWLKDDHRFALYYLLQPRNMG